MRNHERSTTINYWDFSDEKAGEAAVTEAIEGKFATTDEVKPEVFDLLRYLFAAVCYHYDYMDEKLSNSSKLRASPIFIEASVFEFRQFAVIAYPWTATQMTPNLTGIPPHIMLMVEIEKLKNALAKQGSQIVEAMTKELDKRTVGGINFETNKLLGEVKTLLTEVKTNTQSRALPNSQGDVDQEDNSDDFAVDFDVDDDEQQETAAAVVPVRAAPATSTRTNARINQGLKIYGASNGVFRLVPKDFAFPSLTLSTLVTAWHCGDRPNGIPPYKMLKCKDVKGIKSGESNSQ